MTRPNRKDGASAPSNVVRLPTAAPRKIDNLRYAEQRRAMRELRKAEPWPGEYMLPANRQRRQKAEQEAAGLAGFERTPEFFAILCILQVLPDDQIAAAKKAADACLAFTPDLPVAKAGHTLIDMATKIRADRAVLSALDALEGKGQ